MYTKIFKTLFIFIVGFLALNVSASSCEFTRDLEIDSKGEDVRCLQEYLNNSGYTISSSGVGSLGNETENFGELTQKALIRWQIANNITPSKGYFGMKSRMKYNSLIKTTNSNTSNTTNFN